MDFIGQFRKSKEKDNPQTTPPQPGDTLAEIMQDKKKADLFGEFLKEGGNEEIAIRIAGGNIEGGDIADLEAQRKIFLEKMAQAEKVEQSLTEESIVDFARSNEDFEKIVNLVGHEKALKVIKSRLKDLSITDPGRFDRIVDALGEHEKYKNGSYKKVNDDIEKWLKEKNISPEKYSEAMAIKDPKEREKAFKKLAKKQHWVFTRALALGLAFKKGDKDNFKKLSQNANLLEQELQKLTQAEEEIGSALSASVTNNDDMRKAFAGELLGEKAPEKPKHGFKDAKAVGTFDEKKFDKDWEKYKKEKDFSSKGDPEKSTIKDQFIAEQEKAHKERDEDPGFWAMIFEALFTKKLAEKKKTLK